MDDLALNKVLAAILTAGLAFMLTGLIGDALVRPARLTESAIKIDTSAVAAAAPAPKDAAPQEPIAKFLATADAGAGEATAKKVCATCHTFTQGGPAGVGPNLYGVVGGPHAHMQGFNYSDALKSKTGPWNYDELNEWLTKPAAYAPGTRMAFAGISSEKQRADVIAYLRSLSPNPLPLPPAP